MRLFRQQVHDLRRPELQDLGKQLQAETKTVTAALKAQSVDFDRLHTVPDKNSVRYYPINFSDYGWLPRPDINPDEPNAGSYPPALPRARTVPL